MPPTSISSKHLSAFDDFLTDILVDKLYFWIVTNKVRAHKPVRGINAEAVVELLQKHIVTEFKPAAALDAFVGIRAVANYVGSIRNDKRRLNEFLRHTKRYLQMYGAEAGFEICTTDRYFAVSQRSEACVLARRDFRAGEEIKHLSGRMVLLTDDDEQELLNRKRDFSVIYSTRLDGNCLMLGPCRFVNHDCEPSCKFVSGGHSMKLVALRKIHQNEEITVEYSKNYFGTGNKECMCKTCE
ncbi:uncharacterized protein V1510DRAFT_364772, partial [Dipodascopsis tothii]|uniref:uncharacterized protein n=1 Tax=Dipodascopsis tothii TaxID=44089 RepID=UPI0034CF3E04